MTIIYTEDDLEQMVEDYLQEDSFCFDVETRGDFRLDPRRNEVFWITFATHGRVDVVPLGHPNGWTQTGTEKKPFQQGTGRWINKTFPVFTPPPQQVGLKRAMKILEPLFFSKLLKVNHNLKFDIETVAKYYDTTCLPGPYFCTQIGTHVCNENLRVYRLGECLRREFDQVYDKNPGHELEVCSFDVAQKYCHVDGWMTWLLFKRKLNRRLSKQDMDGVFDLEMDILPVLCRMEGVGANIDVSECEKLADTLARQKLKLIGGMTRLANGRTININSTVQLRELLYDYKKDGGFGLHVTHWTKGGKTGNQQPSTSAEALEQHADHPWVKTYLEYKEIDKIHSTYLIPWIGGEVQKFSGDKLITKEKRGHSYRGRIHTNFKQTGTVTGRFSSSEPNLQNVPRADSELGKQVRGLFIAPPGHQLVVADYSQIEYRIMAHYSRDPMLIKSFSDGLDLHQYVAAMVFDKDMEDVTKTERTTAKNTNFAVAYGAGDAKVAAMSGITKNEAIAFRAAHRKMLPTLYRWTEDTVWECRKSKPPHVETLLGRWRRLPLIHSSNDELRAGAERMAVNSVVQGSAADLLKLGMIRFDDLAVDIDGIDLSLQIHDELVVIARDDRVELAQEIMTEALLGEEIAALLSVPLDMEMGVADRWSLAKS